MRRLLAAAVLAAVSCSDSTGPTLGLQDPGLLADQLDAVDRALATPTLRGLSGLATPMNQEGLDITSLRADFLGKSLEWNSLFEQLYFTTRAGAPVDAIRLYLYVTDSTGRPARPPAEVGFVDLYPHNAYTGGGPDSISLRFVVTDTRATPVVVADFTAHSHADSACVQCAVVEGWVDDGTTRVDFRSAYNIPVGHDGRFPGSFSSTQVGLDHFATLPGPGANAATATLALAVGADSIAMTSGPLRPHNGRLDGTSVLTINGVDVATVTRGPSGISATAQAGGHLGGADLRAAGALFAVPADIAHYLEWPVFVIFFCGC